MSDKKTKKNQLADKVGSWIMIAGTIFVVGMMLLILLALAGGVYLLWSNTIGVM